MWKGPIITQIPEFNSHHDLLVGFFYALQKALVSNDADKVMIATLDELSAYSDYHFKAEERLMAEHGFPRLKNHQIEHGQFRTMVREIRANLVSHELKNTIILIKYLENWINEHIATTDQEYDRFYQEKGITSK